MNAGRFVVILAFKSTSRRRLWVATSPIAIESVGSYGATSFAKEFPVNVPFARIVSDGRAEWARRQRSGRCARRWDWRRNGRCISGASVVMRSNVLQSIARCAESLANCFPIMRS